MEYNTITKIELSNAQIAKEAAKLIGKYEDKGVRLDQIITILLSAAETLKISISLDAMRQELYNDLAPQSGIYFNLEGEEEYA